jgi:carbamoyltransferase
MNGHILRSELFEELFVQPAAHDAGGALGAALCAYHQDAPQSLPRHRLQHVFWGTHVGSDAEIATTLDRWSSFLEFEKEEDVARKAARILADGAVIGWIQGRSEFGPRALGNRSILADPRPAENKLRINQMIKKREQYRPFAPAVLAEKLAAYFDVPAGQPEFPFMVIVVPVLEHARQILGATTHVDGTARVQTVSSTTNPLFGNLIRNFGEITGVPVLLNTSFNNNAEPIVDSLDDAVVCFLTTGLDFLVAGNYVVRRKTGQELENQIFGCAIDLPPWRKLVRRPIRSEGSHNWEYLLQSTKSSFFGRRDLPLSEHLFRLLAASTPDVTVEDILLRLAIPSESRMALRAELVGLWSERAITVFPTRTLPAHPGMRSAAHIWTVG